MVEDAEDYTEAVIIKGSDGIDLITLLTDSDGRLVGILQGEYNGGLQTIKLDSEGRMLGRFMPAVENIISGADDNQIGPGGIGAVSSGLVPNGKRWKITNATMYNQTGKSSEYSMWICDDVTFYLIDHVHDVPPDYVLKWNGEIWLAEGEKLYFYWFGGTAYDEIYAYWNGAQFVAEY